MKKLYQKKEGGSWFDDEIAALPDYQPEDEANSLALQDELNSRIGVCLFVTTEKERIVMQSVMVLWLRYKKLMHPVKVLLDSTLPPGAVRVGYPS